MTGECHVVGICHGHRVHTCQRQHLIFVLNTDQLVGSAHILIYQNNVGGEVLFADTGVMTVAPTGTAIVGISLLTGGFYELKIYVIII